MNETFARDLIRLVQSDEEGPILIKLGVEYFLHQLLRYEEDTKWRFTFRPVPCTDDDRDIHVFTDAWPRKEDRDLFLRNLEATGLCPFIGVVK